LKSKILSFRFDLFIVHKLLIISEITIQ